MVRCYLIPARPFWNHWQSATAFVGASMYLGGLLLGSAALVSSVDTLLTPAVLAVALGVLVESVGLVFHARAMSRADHEGGVSHFVQQTTFGRAYQLRNTLLALAVPLSAGLYFLAGFLPAWLLLLTMVLAQSIIGRALFYVLVVPTTMPGAFFWKNKAFEQHARDIGLADMPQVGVANGH